ncbi:hypothetical protein XA68_16458 [Ophiocordyceps unilateralis]|uniref:Uncharacterized protein n=1 Tax=Ophiocordyceps unilateralis TaxID=268505 RepID=A0A2A9PLF9_OPHUN|nr:hypothetical protein XA68_16458 [Ophiocordyceps unilateralis]
MSAEGPKLKSEPAPRCWMDIYLLGTTWTVFASLPALPPLSRRESNRQDAPNNDVRNPVHGSGPTTPCVLSRGNIRSRCTIETVFVRGTRPVAEDTNPFHAAGGWSEHVRRPYAKPVGRALFS